MEYDWIRENFSELGKCAYDVSDYAFRAKQSLACSSNRMKIRNKDPMWIILYHSQTYSCMEMFS